MQHTFSILCENTWTGVSDVKQDQSKVDDKGTGECKYNY